MTKYEVLIFVDGKHSYHVPSRPNSLPIEIKVSGYYDNISKQFTKYRHTIEYKEKYRQYDYDINIYDNRHRFVWEVYPFCYYHPFRKVEHVEFYFSSSDTNNTNPLVVGFRQEGLKDDVYYTFGFLKNKRYQHGLPSPGWFKDGDVLAVLLEEKYRDKNKVLIYPSLKPVDGSAKYPSIGKFANRITVSKSQKSGHNYFDIYEHNIDPNLKQRSFYLKYNTNCLYINCGTKFQSDFLNSVDLYYPKNVDSKTPLVIGLVSKNGRKSYYTYKEIVDKNKGEILLSELKEIYENNLEATLKTENDKIYPTVSFMIEQKVTYSYQINVSNKNDYKLNGFEKYVHERYDQYKDKPSEVLYYGKKLLVRGESRRNVREGFSELKGTFNSVNVFFGIKDENTPLIIEVIHSRESDNIKYYIKSRNDNFWDEFKIKTSDKNNQLLNKLIEAQVSISIPVLILVDAKDNYGESELQKITGVKVSGSQPNSVKVSKDKSLECLANAGFNCYKHTLQFVADSNSSLSTNDTVLKPIMILHNDDSINSSKYTELNLYDISGVTKEYIKYNKGCESFYTYFYDQDLRPLMICYNGTAYRPMSIENYFDKWVKVNGISDCLCKNNDTLLNNLGDVLYCLSPVKLNMNSFNTENSNRYITQTFHNHEKTEITINLSARDLNCYREYTHTPTTGYVLGEICHNGSKLFSDYNQYKQLNGTNFKFPNNVLVYYFLYDFNHDYPLLISLEFTSGGGDSNTVKEYYELVNKDDLKWKKIQINFNSKEQSELENKLREIRNGLGISYEKSPNNLIIKSADNCNEDSIAGAVAGTLSILGLTGVGTGLVYYRYPEFFTSLFRRVLVWTPVPIHF
ncbi:hypothetical protein MACK_002405 [Theileria orientalis]|uniref:Uncharacterized protein n=1 Tax=Theileria orientalis TaxID=68886 RepID=A0A976QX27_THEOR|nr:hypothetical protein MACK_002405 [Theileria orientalis]